MSGTILAGSIGNCVHVAGVVAFLNSAEQLGYKTVFLGAAVSVDEFVEAIKTHNPAIVGVSYRLTPEVGVRLVQEFADKVVAEGLTDRRFVFGGTLPVCEAVAPLGLFERSFTGHENDDAVWAYLRGKKECSTLDPNQCAGTLIERIEVKSPYPILRHHFGLPSLSDTVDGVGRIAESGVLDVISVAPDQNAQESFFRPDEMDPSLDGAGGAPLRTAEDLLAIRDASRCGNYPLLRIYSGTRDLGQWAEMSVETLDNAWAAIPLCWYSTLDGRSTRSVSEAISENQAAMRWYADRSIPVEVNEPHHWALRDAHDTITVVMAYISAYNAKKMGVKHYVAQYMFNTPAGISGTADLAKALAQIEMVESLHDHDFVSFRQVRAGLLHLSPNLSKAKGQLAASTALALSVKPHIMHVVGYCEGDHAATADDVIESCEIVHGVIKNCKFGMPDAVRDEIVQERKQRLLSDADLLLRAISDIGRHREEPLADPEVLAKAIASGLLDAPHLRGNQYALGRLKTRITPDGVDPVDPKNGLPITETERLNALSSRPAKRGVGLTR